MREAIQTVKIKPAIMQMIERMISQVGTPNGSLTIIVTGDVKGMIESQKARLLLGFAVTAL